MSTYLRQNSFSSTSVVCCNRKGGHFVGGAVQQVGRLRDSLIFFRKKSEKAKMVTLVLDAFGHLAVGLSEIDDTAFSVPPNDKIVNDTRLF